MSDSERTVEDEEQRALERLKAELGQHLAYVGCIYNLLVQTNYAFNGRDIVSMRPSLRVCLYLLAKLANDLRCVGLLAERGYGVQACALAASLYETSHMIAYLRSDDDRANDWLAHDDPVNAPKSTRDLNRKNFEAFGLPSEKADTEFRVYRQLCWMKHSNPVAPAIKGLRPPDEWPTEGLSRLGPTTDELAVNAAWFALQHSGNLAAMAIDIIRISHLEGAPSQDIYNQLVICNALLAQLDTLAKKRWGTAMPFMGKW